LTWFYIAGLIALPFMVVVAVHGVAWWIVDILP